MRKGSRVLFSFFLILSAAFAGAPSYAGAAELDGDGQQRRGEDANH